VQLQLGLELVAHADTPLRLGTFFETWLATPAGTLRRSLGRDEFHLDVTIGSGRRLAATGRTHLCQVDLEAAGLGPNQARPATPAAAEVPVGTPVIWGIRTNLFLSLPPLLAGASANLVREGSAPLPFELDHPLVLAEEVAPGRYIIDISALLLTS
jgi:hypothetical protein